MSETRTKESTVKVESVRSTDNREQKIASFRAAVELTSDAVRAVSVTAVDALKASARFMGVVTKEEDLTNPFDNIDAPNRGIDIIEGICQIFFFCYYTHESG